MTMEYEQWKEILSTVNEEGNLSKDNVIEKIREKLSRYSKEWEGAVFGVNHLFQVGNIQYVLLHLVAYGNLRNVAGALLKVEGINVNAKVKDGCTPLHLAAKNGHKEIVDALLAKKADVNAKKENGWTPLHWAAQNGHKEIVDALLAKEADVNAKVKDGCTPLHFAAKNGCRETIDILMAKGADPSLKNKDGKTPMDLDKNGYIKQSLEKKAIKNGIIAGSSVALLGAAIAVTLFATGTVAVELMSVMIAAALAVGGITYSILKPSTKMDETKEAQNVNGNVLGGGKAAIVE